MEKKVEKTEAVETVEKKKVPTKTTAEKIWEEIQDKNIEMFALPAQKVNQYCKPVTIEPSKCYLLTTATSVLPALEVALGSSYVVERVHQWVVVSRA
jgi:hypothetical protein